MEWKGKVDGIYVGFSHPMRPSRAFRSLWSNGTRPRPRARTEAPLDRRRSRPGAPSMAIVSGVAPSLTTRCTGTWDAGWSSTSASSSSSLRESSALPPQRTPYATRTIMLNQTIDRPSSVSKRDKKIHFTVRFMQMGFSRLKYGPKRYAKEFG